jgi:hypothetical protein
MVTIMMASDPARRWDTGSFCLHLPADCFYDSGKGIT